MALTKLTTSSITGDTLAAGDIAADAITASELADNAVDTAAIAADAVTGAKIADDALNSEHYTDGSIDTVHIADDQITLAKMASGTDGNIISYDASGNPVAIATGNDGQVLTSTGAGSPPAFESIAGGTHVKLLAGSASSAVNHDFVNFISSTYHCYLVLLSKVTNLQGNTLDFQFAESSGPFTGSNYFDAAHGFRSNASDRFTQGAENQAQARLGSGLDASSTRTGSYFFYIYANPNNAAFSCSASGHNWGYRADYGDYIHSDFTLGMDNTNTATGFRVHAAGNDATTFDYQIYGIAK